MEGLSLGQIVHFTPSFAAMVLDWIQECIPIRLKAVYVVNNSYIFNMLFAIFKPFISSKLRKRVSELLRKIQRVCFIFFLQIHFMNKDWAKLTGLIGEGRLGKRFGGTLPVEDVDGKLLVEFLHLFDKQYDSE